MVFIIVISWRFYLWKKRKYSEKITDLSHNIVSSTPHNFIT